MRRTTLTLILMISTVWIVMAQFRLVFQGARLPGRDASMAQLAFVLQAVVMDRPVLDKTGLMGNFDFDLSWRPNETQFGGRGGTMPADPDSTETFAAVQEQLGQKLESQKIRWTC